jgi:autotransporter-associated beta strand protein
MKFSLSNPFAAIAVVVLVSTANSQAADRTWDGGGGDDNWNTAANWDAAIATGDSLFFDGSTRLTPTNDTTANSDYNITFNSGASAFTLSGNIIDLISDGFIVNNSTNAQAVNHAIELLGNGNFTSNGGTLTIGGALTEAGGAAKTLTVNGAGNVTISGAISASNGDLNIVKTGSGTLTLSGNNVNLSNNDVIVNAGTLILDYSTQNNTKLDTSVLTLGGGTLTMSGGSGNEDPASSTLTAGASAITRNSGSRVLRMDAITRNTGATLDIATASIAAADGNLNNDGIIQGGYLTLGGTTWAVKSDGNNQSITGLATYETSTTQGDWAITENISLSANPTASVTNRTINSLRLTDAVTFTITAGNTLTLDAGGLLVTGSAATNITGGTLTIAGARTDLVVHQYSSADLTINSVIANTTAADALTKTGTGRLILGNANTFTGQTYVNQGVLSISANNNLGAAATGAQLNLDGGTLEATATFGLFNGSAGTNNRAVDLADKGGTIAVTGSNTLIVAGVVGGIGSLTKSDTGALAVTNANTYTGGTSITGGTLFANNASGSATGTGAVSVGASGTLAGSGFIVPTGTNGINVSGVLAPGGSVGTGNLTLNLGSTTGTVTMSSGSGFEFLLGTAGVSIVSVGSSDLLAIAGAAANDFAFSGNDVNFLNSGALGFYKLFDTSSDNANTWTGLTFDSTTGVVSSGLTYSNLASGLSGAFIVGTAGNGGTTGDIYFQVIPEPGSALLGGLGTLLLLRRRRTA